jgi:hypothetical protein
MHAMQMRTFCRRAPTSNTCQKAQPIKDHPGTRPSLPHAHVAISHACVCRLCTRQACHREVHAHDWRNARLCCTWAHMYVPALDRTVMVPFCCRMLCHRHFSSGLYLSIVLYRRFNWNLPASLAPADPVGCIHSNWGQTSAAGT